MKTITKKLLIIWVMFLCVVVFAADVPKSINYQGLLSEDGRAVNGTRDITFRLYDAFDAEISFWDRTESVEIIDGVFNELLGPFNTAQLDKFATSVGGVYLEIEVDSEVFPRQQLLSVGYAFRAQSAADVDDNAIDSAKIADETIVSADIQNKTIQIEDLADEVLDGGGVANGSITTSKLADGAVTSQKIAYETIVSTNIKDNAIGSSEIATNAVDSDEIATDAVGSDEIATDAVGSDEIATGAVDSDEIADGAVTAAKLADDAIPSSVPSGTIVMWAGTSLSDEGWAFCDGSAVSRTTYAKLFEVIGVRFGSGNGSTTFNLPDLRDRFIVAWGSDYGIGATGGSNTTTLSVVNLPSHTHPVIEDTGNQSVSHTHNGPTDSDGNHRHGITYRAQRWGGVASGFGDTVLAIADWNTHDPNTDYDGDHTHPFTTKGNNENHIHSMDFTSGSTGSGTAIENRPLYYALAYIMKL